MAVTLTEAELLTDISKDERDYLAAQSLEDGQDDPVDTLISESWGMIEMYINPFIVKDAAVKRIWKILSITGLYNRLQSIPEKRKEERDWAIKTLEGIRDGKFPNLVIDTSLDEAEAIAGDYGGACRQRIGDVLATGNTTVADT